MKYDFDKLHNRMNTGSVKYDFFKENGRPEDTIPLWVADMDFTVPEPVIEALRKTVDFGIFGYGDTMKDYFEAVSGWFKKRFGWEPKEEWLVKTPGVVFAFNTAINALTNPGDSVIIQTPVYYPFTNAINNNGRTLIENPLVLRDGEYYMDLEDFEKKIVDNNVKMFIFCSPHNPVGRVWTKDELKAVSDICLKHNVFIVCDEIHCDFTWQDHKHEMFLNACPESFDHVISCTAPSKTFNLAGLQASNIWIPNKENRNKFNMALEQTGFFALNIMGIAACQAAYSQGEEWFEQCKDYIYDNFNYLKGFIEENLPMLKVMDLQGTYLAWVDFSGLGLSPEEVDDLISNKARLWLDQGKIFGTGGENFQRFVLACPRTLLEEALTRLNDAIKSL